MPRPRVLVVDDDLPIRQLIADLLGGEGYLVSQAANGREALEQMSRARPDAIVLDLMMPVMDGRAFVHNYYVQSHGRPAPILLMSASPVLKQGASQLFGLGVKGYIAKPFDVFKLLDSVAGLTEQQGLLTAAAR